MVEDNSFIFKDIYKELKNKDYQKSNHEGVHVCYEDSKTYLKIDPKKQITLSEGSFYTIMRHPSGLKEENIKLEQPAELHNMTNEPMFCVLKDCLFDNEPRELKLIIKKGIQENG